MKLEEELPSAKDNIAALCFDILDLQIGVIPFHITKSMYTGRETEKIYIKGF